VCRAAAALEGEFKERTLRAEAESHVAELRALLSDWHGGLFPDHRILHAPAEKDGTMARSDLGIEAVYVALQDRLSSVNNQLKEPQARGAVLSDRLL
jgi:hypothetical protein